ncbi:MAG: M36 family metallopeptidase [Bacteroidota bacterium]
MNANSTSCAFLFGTYFLLLIFSSSTFAQSQQAFDQTLRHVNEVYSAYHLSKEDISNFRLSDLYTSKHNGVTHVYLQQQHAGIDVENALINVNVMPSGKILNMGSRFVANVSAKVNTTEPSISPEDALQKVLFKFAWHDNPDLMLKERVSEQYFIFENEGLALEPLKVKLVYAEQENRTVKLVWQVNYYAPSGDHMWNVQVDATNGVILGYVDEVVYCSFEHPDKACHEAHPSTFAPAKKVTSKVDIKQKVETPTTPPTVMSNAYHVYPLPIESPNHGSNELVIAAPDSVASPFGWHDTDGVEGPEYTITRGNNVHAYQDIFNQNKSLGDEPDGGMFLEFNFPHDPTNDSVYQQLDAAAVNLFYWNNIVHDMWYHYGFDEPAGNFQQNNYDKGGVGEDYVRAEALDGGGRNNATFFTPDDGQLPRMRMFLWQWTNPTFQTYDTELIAVDSANDTLEFTIQPAQFGGPLPSMPVVSELVRVDDGIGDIYDACENIGNGFEVEGKIALIDRGDENDCPYGERALRAQNEGAIAVIVCNRNSNNPGSIITMTGGPDGAAVNIPVMMASQRDCDTIKLRLPNITVTLQAPDFTVPDPGPIALDSDFDNGVIVHEYTHGISNRLTGGPSNSDCLRNFEQAGEGWSDWFALAMTTTSNNNAEQPRGIGTYLTNQATDSIGIREFPYSRDMSIDPHTYGDLGDQFGVHGRGSIWAVTTWDMYWNLVDKYGFDDDLTFGTGGNNIAMQLVLDGLKFQPCSPTFIDSRDAILMADSVNNDGENYCLIWETFARRGLGFSAQPNGVEAFDLPLDCQFRLKIAKTASAEIMAGETLTYTLEIKNDSPDTLFDLVITDSLPDGVELDLNSVSCGNNTLDNNILSINLGDVPTGEVITCTYDVVVAETPFSYIVFEDDIENGIGQWSLTADQGNDLWMLTDRGYQETNGWVAASTEEISDRRITTVDSYILDGEHPSLSFWHRYDTETNRDGGVVEISTDGGVSWNDLRSNFVQNGYNNLILNSILSGDFGFTGNSQGYINSVVDLSEYQGEEVLIRFRYTSNSQDAVDGWYVDDVKIFGNFHAITNRACANSVLGENTCNDFTSAVFGDPTTAVNSVVETFDVSLFPNPTTGKVFLKMQSPRNTSTTFRLSALDGRTLKTERIDYSNGTFDFDLSEFPDGVYLLQIQTETNRVVKKVILQ